MTSAEAIAIIESSLPTAEDAALEAAAQLLRGAGDEDLSRPLTQADLASIQQGIEDFRAGRTYTSAEVRAYLDQRRAERACARS